jgi:hypothetical protein
MKSIVLSDGSRVETFEKPPADFSLRSARPQDLLRYGFPAAPSHPLLKRLHSLGIARLANRLKWVEPSFAVLSNKGHGFGRRRQATGAQIFDNWCGVQVSSPARDSISWVTGSWVVPNVSVPTDKCDHYSCHWVGIDGNGSTEPLFQAGVECDVTGGGAREFYAWYEWLPDNATQVMIKGIKVQAGDYVTAIVCSDSGAGSTSGTVYFTNSTSGEYTSFRPTAPNSALLGSTAEWISEVTEEGGVIDSESLADFGEVYFGSALAGTVGDVLLDGFDGAQIEMQDPTSKQELGIGIPVGVQTVRTVFMGTR